MPHNIYVQGSYIDIHDCETVNLSCNGAEVHVDKQPLPTSSCETEPAIGNPDASLSAEDDDIDTHLNHLTDEQVKASGIRCQPRVALALMRAMQPACVQKVDWLSFYSVLLNRGGWMPMCVPLPAWWRNCSAWRWTPARWPATSPSRVARTIHVGRMQTAASCVASSLPRSSTRASRPTSNANAVQCWRR